MTRVAANEMRKDFAEALNRVAYTGERIIIHRRGRDAAVLVPIEDLALIEAAEDKADIAAAKKAKAEKGANVPLDKAKKNTKL
jgi:prevent-host-death family protein